MSRVKKTGQNRGFTLIELLVVIAIIGILSSIILVSLNSARQRARDSRRVADIRQIATALEFYFDSFGTYPGDNDATGCNDLLTTLAPDYMSSVPTDPSTGNSYGYEADAAKTDYVLRAILETGNSSLLDNDVDGTVYGCDCSDANNAYCYQP